MDRSPKPLGDKLTKYIIIPWSGCWIWMGSTDANGYGMVKGTINKKEWAERAHRLSYIHHVGPIPDGMWVLHDCDIPSCINPYHLHLGDPAMNMQEMSMRDRHNNRWPKKAADSQLKF